VVRFLFYRSFPWRRPRPGVCKDSPIRKDVQPWELPAEISLHSELRKRNKKEQKYK
jgi:hypothetical protein